MESHWRVIMDKLNGLPADAALWCEMCDWLAARGFEEPPWCYFCKRSRVEQCPSRKQAGG